MGSEIEMPNYKLSCIHGAPFKSDGENRNMNIKYKWWFFLFYVLVYTFFCAVGALCMFSYF